MNVLVIGGAGYIGSHTVRAFLDAQADVTVYDNLSTGLEENLFPDARFEKGDIHDEERLRGVMKRGFDGVVHFAAFKAAGESMYDPGKFAENNIAGTIRIINACLEAKIVRIVFSSSSAVFGEPRYTPIDEEHPTEPINFYGFTKLEIERLLGWYDRLRGLKFAALRYFNAAGYDGQGRISGKEKNPENLIPIIMEVATGIRDRLKIFGNDYETRDGTCIRDYVHVTDLADAHVLALQKLIEKNESFTVNLGSETGISVLEMLETARRITGREIKAHVSERRPGDPAALVASSAKAAQILGWRPAHSDAENIVRTTWAVYNRGGDA